MKILFCISLLIFTTFCFAQNNFIACGTKLQYAQIGDSLTTVIEKCGNPAQQTTKPVQKYKTQTVEEWIYNYLPNQGFDGIGTLKTTRSAMTIDFVRKGTVLKAIKIIVGGQSVDNSALCQSTNVDKQKKNIIRIGDTSTRIYQVCGWANIEHEVEKKIPTEKAQETVFSYSKGVNGQPFKLYFENGKLIKIES